jgi:serine/threonine protein kinase
MLVNRFKILKQLGRGVTADVKLVEDIKNKKLYACKIFN